MKRKLIALLLILLSLSLIAVFMNTAEATVSGGSGGGGGSSGGSSSGSSSTVTSWVDPYTGIDIFDYENELDLHDGSADLSYGSEMIGIMTLEDGVTLYEDERVTIPDMEGMEIFNVNIGASRLESGYTYYFYYFYNHEWRPMILNGYESMQGSVYELGMSLSGYEGENHEHGFKPFFDMDVNFVLKNGLEGTDPYSVPGTYSLRIIKVPT